MSPKDGPRLVCDLCREPAGRLGWVDPAAAGPTSAAGPRPRYPNRPRVGSSAPRTASTRAMRRERRRTDADPRPALGLGRLRGRLAERGPDHLRLGPLLVPVGYRSRRRPAARSSRSTAGPKSTKLDGSARQWKCHRRERGAGSRSAPPPPASRSAEPWRRWLSTSTAAPGEIPGRPRSASSSRTRTAGSSRSSASGSATRPTTSPSTGRCCSGSSGRWRWGRPSWSWSATPS